MPGQQDGRQRQACQIACMRARLHSLLGRKLTASKPSACSHPTHASKASLACDMVGPCC